LGLDPSLCRGDDEGVARLLRFLILTPLLYLAGGAIGGAIPRNIGWEQPESGVTIYVASNGWHTGLVLPTRAGGVDWSSLVRPEHIRDPRYAGRWLWFGWGERDFYLNTPTWGDVRPRTVLRAAVGSGNTLVHVDHLLLPYEDARPIRLTQAQYHRLAARLRASFASGRPIPGYDVADVFYPAQGRYDLFRTCNWWTAELLAEAGVRVGVWTPFSATVMQRF
jgi:uncharacterized protein (TIGR02117 family)